MGTFECSVKHETAASLVRRESTATTSLDRRSTGVSGPTADGAGHSLPKSESSMRDVAPTFEGAVAVRPLSVRLHYQQQQQQQQQQQHQQQQELQEERRQPQSHRAETRGVHDAGPTPGSGTRAGNARASQFAAAFQVDVSVTNSFERPNLPPTPSQTSGARALYVNAMAMPSPTLSMPSHQALSMVPGPVVTARYNSMLNSTGTEKTTPLERGVVNRDYHGTALLSSAAPSGAHHRPATETVDSNSLGGGKSHGTDSASNQTMSMMDPNAPIFASTHPATPNVVAPAAPSPVAPPSTLPFPLPSPLSNMSTPTSATTNYSSLTAIQGPVSPSRKKNSTPLHYACRFGHIQVVQTILESALKNGGEELARIEADLVAADWKQMTPVHVAAKHGQEAVVALLVQFAQHRASMLAMAAVSAPAPEANVCARRWLRAVLDAQCGEGATALMLAAQHGHASCVRHLLSARDGVDPTRRTLTRGWTAATFAARYGHAGVLRELIQVTDARGCLGMPPAVQTDAFTWDASDVLDVPDAQDGNTPLMVAAKYGKAESVRQLLLAAAWSRAAAKRPAVNAHAANVNGQTAVHLAAQHGHNEVVGELLRFLPTAATAGPASASSSTTSSSSASSTRQLSAAIDAVPSQQSRTEPGGLRIRQTLTPLEIPNPHGPDQTPQFIRSMNVHPSEMHHVTRSDLLVGSDHDHALSIATSALPTAPTMGAFVEYPQAGWSVWGAASISPLSPTATVPPAATTTAAAAASHGNSAPFAPPLSSSGSFPHSHDASSASMNGESHGMVSTRTDTPSAHTSSSTPSSISPLLNGRDQDGVLPVAPPLQRDGRTASLPPPLPPQVRAATAEPRWDAWINDLVGE